MPRHISPEKAKKLLETITSLARKGVRDAEDMLVLESFLRLGARSCELLGLTKDDVDVDGSTVHVRGAKGSTDHLVPVPKDFAERLHAYLHVHVHVLGHRSNRPSTRRLRELIERHASLFPAGTTLHGLRATFAVLIYSATRDILLTKELLGHKSISSTMHYVKLSTASVRRKEILKAFKN